MTNKYKRKLAYLIALSIAVFTSGCKKAATSTQALPAEPGVEVIEDSSNSSSPSTTVDSVKVLTTVNRKTFPFNGNFFSAISWHDKMGNNTLVISEKGTYDDGNGRKEIFAYHYTQRDSIPSLLWQMNDFVDGEGCDLNIDLIRFFPLISDVDSNGIAETAIFYSLNNRCDASTFPAKLIVHEGEEKMAIRGERGQFLGPSEEEINKYRSAQGLPPMKYKNVDAATASMASSIANHYTKQWDAFITLENDLQGALPDTVVQTIE